MGGEGSAFIQRREVPFVARDSEAITTSYKLTSYELLPFLLLPATAHGAIHEAFDRWVNVPDMLKSSLIKFVSSKFGM